MTKPLKEGSPSSGSGISVTATLSMRARGGGWDRSCLTISSRAAAGPATSISTPAELFNTQPDRPSRTARL